MRRIGAALAVVAMAVVVAWQPAPLLGQHPGIAFEDEGPLALTPETTEPLVLLNDTASDVSVKLRAVNGDGAQSFAISVSPADLVVAAGGVATIQVLAASTEEEVKGYVVATATPRTGGASLAARRPFTVGVAAVAFEPWVATWRSTAYRRDLRGARVIHHVIPLKGTTCPSEGMSLGETAVANPKGGAALVTATCTTDGVETGNVGALLTFRGLDEPGDYTGTIDLQPDTDKGAIALTVRRTDGLVMPVIFLSAGILIAIVAAWWTGRGNTLSQDEQEIWELLAEAEKAQRQFVARASGKPWARYSYEPDMSQVARAVVAGLRKANRRLAKLGTDDPERKQILAPRETMAKLITVWPDVATRLGQLSDAVSTVEKAAKERRHQLDPAEPAFLANARSLLIGKRLTVTQALARASEVETMTTMAEAWISQSDAVESLQNDVDLVTMAMADVANNHPDRTVLARAQGSVSSARQGLWTAKGPGEWTVEADMKAARRDLDSLLHYTRRTDLRAAGQERATEAASALPEPGPSELRWSLDRDESPRQAASRIAQRRRVRNVVVLALVAFVALSTGLTTLYFDKPFGTPRDYVAALLWGFTVQATLETVAAAVDRLRTRVVSAT